MQNEERRAYGVSRTPFQAIVEIRGTAPEVPAFEAEAIDVSGRGMHVRTAFVPELAAPLICRFVDRGREVVVEGVVAWRVCEERGGDFGIQFTALDKASLAVLGELCEGMEPPDAPHPAGGELESEEALVGLGTRVRLHIDGLSTPMKAAVREGRRDRLQVGSNLEFLRVGRRLELEEQGTHSKRSACIDAVDVMIDPATGVPQLVVALRMDLAEQTPEPAVVDVEPRGVARPRPEEPATDEASPHAAEPGSVEGSNDPGAELLRDASGLGARALERSQLWTQRAVRGTVSLAQRVGRRVESGWRQRALASSLPTGWTGMLRPKGARAKPEPRRATAPAPNGGFALGGARRMPPGANGAPRRRAATSQSGASAPQRASQKDGAKPSLWSARIGRLRRPRAIAAVAVVSVVVVSGVWALSGSAPPEVQDAFVSEPAQASEAPNRQAEAVPLAAARKTKSGIVADVPLFGPRPLTTTEAIPAGPEAQAQPGSVEQRERQAAERAAREMVGDKTLAGQPWGKGRLHLPTIHRLELDAPGAEFRGSVEPEGFSVTIPGRRVVGKVSTIERRDSRIAAVDAVNGDTDAKVTFRFRETVPAYRVRLRNKVVEFLVSAPGEGG